MRDRTGSNPTKAAGEIQHDQDEGNDSKRLWQREKDKTAWSPEVQSLRERHEGIPRPVYPPTAD